MNADERVRLRTLLRDIWTEFRVSYYEDDQEIIAYLAYLLTRGREPITKELHPGPTPTATGSTSQRSKSGWQRLGRF